ncbi:polysaccharide deacetylase family protein [Roseiterribacter gracilis]|uniref:polysaccharide deacetylase family protein n=1 Tax=Roseiterribacter gracilis TaxID=2812848 RepID=UPI003B42C796
MIVVIDAEEEFDWFGEFSRNATNVTSMAHQGPAQALLNRHGVVPTYAVDYPVAAQEEGYASLRDWVKDGACEIGAQLHPWVNPPFDEAVTPRNSFPGNLPADLEAAKLQALTDRIEATFGVRPRVYRAGRYGIGPNTAALLSRAGYLVDSSTVPFTDMRSKFGPDFRAFRPHPYWFGPGARLLELPVTSGLVGRLGARAPWLHDVAEHRLGRALRLGAVLARTGALMRVRLTPEGVPIDEAISATRSLYEQGLRVFTLSWHTPSMVPGHTPYVRSARDLSLFLDWLRRYLDFFFGELQGKASTPLTLRDELLADDA